MEDSVFIKIYKGEIPGEVLYEDALCFVIPTIEPVTPGHILVIPKEQTDHLWDVSDVAYTHLMGVVKQMANTLRKAYDYKRIAMTLEGFGVPHAHVHLFGIDEGLDPTIIRHAASKKAATNEEIAETAAKIRAAL
jgi:histidine triad (HIT) family protein